MATYTPSPKLETLGDPLVIGDGSGEAIAAVDAAFDEIRKKHEAAAAETPDEAPEETPAETPVETPEETSDDTPAETPKETPAEKPAETPEETPAEKTSTDMYPDIKLPATARGASAQAFATLKAQAAKDLGERDNQLTTLRSELEQLRGHTVPSKEVEDLRKEVEELRQFRARLDIQADPGFNEKFTGRANSINEFIYSRLKSSGKLKDDVISKIKSLGGPAEVDMEPIFKAVGDPQLVRLLQGKLDELETVEFEKEQALKAAQGNVKEYVETRRKEAEQGRTVHVSTTKEILTKILTDVPWMAPKQLKPDAKPEEKESAQKHQKFLDEVNTTLNQAMSDDSPEMRAVLVAGIAHQMNTKAMFERTKAEKDALSVKLADTEKRLADVTSKWESAKKSSAARRDGNAPAGPIKAKVDPFTSTAEDALETFRKTQRANA